MTTERRKYFRIDDVALVKYRVVQDDSLELERRKVYLNQIKFENARAALFGLETELQETIEQVRARDPQIVSVLELLNRKVNLLERVISLEHQPASAEEHFEHEPKEINLSGGGLAIRAMSPLVSGANLAIDLVLLPSNDPMRVFGNVVDCQKIEDGLYTISIAFTEIRQEDQDRLIRHVLLRQSTRLREQRKLSA